jgi:UDP-N-acetylglucosamine acyltransferase
MPAAQIHPTAILEGDVRIGDDCVIGPFCVIRGSVSIGAGTRLLGNVYLQGPLTLGERNKVYPFCSLGFSPQDLKWDPEVPGAGLVIGSGNTFRESVTIHRATSHETPSRMGDNNYWMANSHSGHDCQVGNHCIVANNTALAGFVRMDDRVILGGNGSVHQFCRVGRGVMFSGGMGTSMDVPPYFLLTGNNIVGSINLVGLRRSGFKPTQIDTVRWVYRTLYRQGLSIKKAMAVLQERGDDPLVREYIEFIEQSKRGICKAVGKRTRGTVPLSSDSGDAAERED